MCIVYIVLIEQYVYVLPVLCISLIFAIAQVTAQTEQSLHKMILHCVPLFAVSMTSWIAFWMGLQYKSLGWVKKLILWDKNSKAICSAIFRWDVLQRTCGKVF